MSRCPEIAAWEELAPERAVDAPPADMDAPADPLHLHLRECPACRRAFENLRQNERLLGSLRAVLREPPPAPLDEADALLGQHLGQYQVVRVLGTGGMAVVYEAVQEHPHRTVALKLPKPGWASPAALRRFTYEAEVLGRLQHPGIAQIFEAGLADLRGRPQPFFAMELIRGRRLTDYAAEQRLDARRRLELFAQVCDAAQYAHQQGVIHRDLKPGNILVDERGQPKILDFGVARAADADWRATASGTDLGQIVGTLAYMSPEQAAGDPRELDTRADIYALGAVCYELLSGRLPCDVRGKGALEAARTIREQEPPPLGSLQKAFRGDLETIVAKALEKDKTRRYASASDLAADVRRSLRNEPIAARPPSAAYLLKKFARRNKALAAGVTLAVGGLAVGFVVATWQAVRATRAETETARQKIAVEKARDESQAFGDFWAEAIAAVKPGELGRDVPLRVFLDAAAERIRGQFAQQPLIRARLQSIMGNTYLKLGDYASAETHLQEALAVRRRELGDLHPDTLRSMNDLAVLRHQQGRLEEAEELIRRTAVQEQALKDAPADLLSLRNNLAVMFAERGELERAVELHRQTLEITRRALGEAHLDTLISMNNLAECLRKQKKTAEAQVLYRQALQIGRRALGEDAPEILTFAGNLAQCCLDQKQYEEAEALYQLIVEKQRRVLGPDHPDTLQTLGTWAGLYYVQRQFGKAEPLYAEALESSLRQWGEADPATLRRRVNLAVLYLDSDQYAEAEPLLLKNYALRRAAQGEEAPQTRAAAKFLVELYEKWDKPDQAAEFRSKLSPP